MRKSFQSNFFSMHHHHILHLLFSLLFVLHFFHRSEEQGFRGSYVAFNGHGHRLSIFVAISCDWSYSKFIENLQHFASAFDCPYRQKFISFYFGDLSTKIDCDYPADLVDCVRQRLLNNSTFSKMAYQVDT
jgi:hypothetical protein